MLIVGIVERTISCDFRFDFGSESRFQLY